jgi:hypothetical protein
VESRRGLRRLLATVLWFGIDGGWIYYVILFAYGLLVAAGIWLISRHGWLPAVGGCIVLLDGMTTSIFLLYRWAVRRLR